MTIQLRNYSITAVLLVTALIFSSCIKSEDEDRSGLVPPVFLSQAVFTKCPETNAASPDTTSATTSCSAWLYQLQNLNLTAVNAFSRRNKVNHRI